MLVIIAQGISTADLLPVTNKTLWITTFTYGSFFWVLFANMESVFVAWLYFLEDDDDNKPKAKEQDERNCSEGSESAPKEGDMVQLTQSSTERYEEQVGGDIESGGSQHVTFRDDENQQGHDRPRMERRGAFVCHPSKRASSRRLLTFRRRLFTGSKSTRHRTIKKIDQWCFYVLFISYVLFVILMFATNSLWDNSTGLYTPP
jgi:hypothetical protein